MEDACLDGVGEDVVIVAPDRYTDDVWGAEGVICVCCACCGGGAVDLGLGVVCVGAGAGGEVEGGEGRGVFFVEEVGVAFFTPFAGWVWVIRNCGQVTISRGIGVPDCGVRSECLWFFGRIEKTD